MPSPIPFFEAINAYQNSAAINAAINLEVFTAIAEGVTTTEALAERCSASPKGIRILCDFLVVMGTLTKESGRYGLTEDSAVFLNKHSPAYLGGTVRFLHSDTIKSAWADATEFVRKGASVLPETGTMAPDHPVWRDFARAMVPMMAPPAEFIAQTCGMAPGTPCKILDVAAGHGMFGITMARHNPAATVWACDWDAVLDVAREHAHAAGVADRFNTLAGSAFDIEFGSGYDVALVTNFFHHFNAATCETLIRKLHAALGPQGRVVTLEFVPDEDRVSPPVPAAFAIMMLATTADGDAYTFGEYQRMFANAGFPKSEMLDVPMSPQRLIISSK